VRSFSLLSDFAFLAAALLLAALALGLRFGIADRSSSAAEDRIARLEARVERLRDVADRIRRLEADWTKARRAPSGRPGGAAGDAPTGGSRDANGEGGASGADPADAKRTGHAAGPRGLGPVASPFPADAPARLADAVAAASQSVLEERLRAVLGPVGAKPAERRSVIAAYELERRERSDVERRGLSDGLNPAEIAELRRQARERRLATIRDALGARRFDRVRSVLPEPLAAAPELAGSRVGTGAGTRTGGPR